MTPTKSVEGAWERLRGEGGGKRARTEINGSPYHSVVESGERWAEEEPIEANELVGGKRLRGERRRLWERRRPINRVVHGGESVYGASHVQYVVGEGATKFGGAVVLS